MASKYHKAMYFDTLYKFQKEYAFIVNRMQHTGNLSREQLHCRNKYICLFFNKWKHIAVHCKCTTKEKAQLMLELDIKLEQELSKIY